MKSDIYMQLRVLSSQRNTVVPLRLLFQSVLESSLIVCCGCCALRRVVLEIFHRVLWLLRAVSCVSARVCVCVCVSVCLCVCVSVCLCVCEFLCCVASIL